MRTMIALAAIAMIGAAGCMSANNANAESKKPPAPARVDPALVSGHNRFGARMLRELAVKPGANVFFSPYSISTALSMTWNGAAGQTKADMAKALNIDGLAPDMVNSGSAALKAALETPREGAKISVANSLWAQKGAAFKPAFLAVNRQDYGAEVSELDFLHTPAGSVNTINAWTSQHTNGKIPKILASVDSSTVMVLVNAIHFKGKWADQFTKSSTQPAPFTLHSGAKMQVPMMHRGGDIRALTGEDFAAVSLPYADKRTSMVIFLPNETNGLPAFIQGFTPEKWDEWRKSFRPREGSVAIPKFRLEWGAELTAPLSRLGMASAFTGDADFSAMMDRPLAISQVQHKAFVDVDEEGTEAAAATAVGIRATSVMLEPFRFVADHPFLCAIVDDPTGEILFLGAVYQPK
ncbi:MAG TPA: serpin family protein [Armatimonadota bacterium]